MAEIKYVDWDGLVYYDGKSKQYIDNKFDENFDKCLKFGGVYNFDEVPSPGVETLNYIYKIIDEFSVSPDDLNFVQSALNHEYAAGTIIRVVEEIEDQYRFDILFEAITSAPLTPDGQLDLSNYYTKDEVEDLIRDLPTKEYIDNAIQNVTIDTSNLVTKEELSNVENKIPSLDGYAKVEDIPSDYITEDELNAKGFITEHQDISGKADKEHTHILGDITDYEPTDLTGYATEEFVNKKIAEAELADKEADLEAYYTKSEVDALIPDTSKFITEIPSEYITKEELDSEGFLKEHQDLSEYAKKTDIPDVTNFATKDQIPSTEGFATEQFVKDSIDAINIPDTSNFITMQDVESKGYLTEHQDISHLATKDEIPDVSNFLTEIPTQYITETELDAKSYATKDYVDEVLEGIVVVPDLSEYAKKTDIPSLEGYATEDFVATTLSEGGYLTDIPEEYVVDTDLENYFTKEETSKTIEDAIEALNLPEVLSEYTTDVELKDAIDAVEDNIATKANDILFTENYIVSNPTGLFSQDESVQNLTLTQIITKLLGLTLYEPPVTPDGILEGTPVSAIEIINNSTPCYVLGEDGSISEIPYEYRTMTSEEANTLNDTESFFYQIVDSNGVATETGYHVTPIYQEKDFLTVLIPSYVSNFTVNIWDGVSSGSWIVPQWTFIENSNYSLEGYTAYTADVNYQVYPDNPVRIIINE